MKQTCGVGIETRLTGSIYHPYLLEKKGDATIQVGKGIIQAPSFTWTYL
jgi:hypothetical protein